MSAQVIYTKMEECVALEAGWDRTTDNWSTDRDNLFKYFKKDALSRFENAYPWSFLNIRTTLDLVPTYSTGTVEIAAGVVTLTGGTFPAWAEYGDLWITDDGAMQRYSVDSRDGNTQITLDDTSVAVSSGATYALRRHTYDLPSDFGGAFVRGFSFRRDSIYSGQTIEQVGHAEFQQHDSDILDGTGAPRFFLLQPVAVTATASSRWQVLFTPLPGEAMQLDYHYKAIPADVDGTNDYPYGGAIHSETILASLRYSVDLYFHRPNAEERRMEYARKLQDSIRADGQFRPIDYGPGSQGIYWSRGERHAYASIDDATLFTN